MPISTISGRIRHKQSHLLHVSLSHIGHVKSVTWLLRWMLRCASILALFLCSINSAMSQQRPVLLFHQKPSLAFIAEAIMKNFGVVKSMILQFLMTMPVATPGIPQTLRNQMKHKGKIPSHGVKSLFVTWILLSSAATATQTSASARSSVMNAAN